MADAKRILVLCTGNRCRSQMGEGWIRYFGGPDVEVYSAGTNPKGLHPKAVEVMAKAGVDISGQTSDHVNRYLDRRFDLVVTVCDRAKESCPVFPKAHKLVHNQFDDPDAPGLPADELDALFVRVCGEVRDWARELVKSL